LLRSKHKVNYLQPTPFTRATLIAAVELLEQLSQAKFSQLVLRLELENEIFPAGQASVPQKCAMLGNIVVSRANAAVASVDGLISLGEAVVREALALLRLPSPLTPWKSETTKPENPQEARLIRGLARDGYAVSWSEASNPTFRRAELRRTLPEQFDLAGSDDEVHLLLKEQGFQITLGHLEQAIAAHGRGNWAAGQLRTFLESLFDEIARIKGCVSESSQSSENRRSFLAQKGFFATHRNEWTADGKNYLNGLFKMLHSDGSHPGLSDEEHCTFRLHLVLVTARTFLRRFRYNQ
jgi:hypothetical protein